MLGALKLLRAIERFDIPLTHERIGDQLSLPDGKRKPSKQQAR